MNLRSQREIEVSRMNIVVTPGSGMVERKGAVNRERYERVCP